LNFQQAIKFNQFFLKGNHISLFQRKFILNDYLFLILKGLKKGTPKEGDNQAMINLKNELKKFSQKQIILYLSRK